MPVMTLPDPDVRLLPGALPDSARTPRGAFWSRYKTLINFWLDVALAVLFLVVAWLLAVVVIVFPPNAAGWTLWGATVTQWLDRLLAVFCLFAAGIVLHVMLHWTWICGTVATRLMGRKAGKDDGSQTLIGVGLLIVLLHLFGAAVLAARVYLKSPR
jgi:hypothetical protein